ncbi:hypothetical protein GCM10009668_19850 [Nocardioides dubius]|uniref:Endonuclease/exonuclease/phosphatase domain-containing protein n=1 Tax=Nocardioides dubius TaxID=317019 RepID=A0ABP4EEI1_9ACTN
MPRVRRPPNAFRPEPLGVDWRGTLSRVRKLPDWVVILAPAALITALVVLLGYLMVGGEEPAENAASRAGGGPVSSQPGVDLTDEPLPEDVTTSPAAEPSAAGQSPGTSMPKLTGPQITLRPKPKVKVIESTTITISSFNVLGHSHTEKGGHKARLAPGPTRMADAIRILDSHQVGVVGLQELQTPQMQVLARHANWSVYPGGGVDQRLTANSIAWRNAEYEAISTETTPIPYFAGEIRQMPVVLLEHKASGQRFYVANFHNPANAHGDASRWRAEALRRQIALANTLAENELPIFFTGDMNDREGYFCGLTTSTAMKAANGGSTGTGCQPPPKPMPVDWIFGSDEVTFTGYVADRSPAVARTTDHPVVVAQAVLPERREKVKP